MPGNRSTTLVAGGTRIKNILNVSVADDTWTAVALGSLDTCRSITAGLRSGSSFKLSHLSDGSLYRTLQGNIEIDVIKESNKVLFYIQTSSGNDTLECVLLD